MRATLVILGSLLAIAAVACGGAGGSGDEEAFCERVRELQPQLQGADWEGLQLSPQSVDAIRELAEVAPDSVRDDIDTLTELPSQEEAIEASLNVQEYMRENCGVST